MDTRKLNSYIKYFESILKGEKLPLNEYTQPVFVILKHLHKSKMLTEKPQEYFTSDEYIPIGDTSQPSMPSYASRDRKSYRSDFKDRRVNNVRTMGTVASNITSKKLDIIYYFANASVLPANPSLQGVYEFLWLLDQKKKGHTNETSNLAVIDKEDNKIFKILRNNLDLTDKELEKLNVLVENGHEDVVDKIAKKTRKNNRQEELLFREMEFDIPPGSTIYDATTSDKKLFEKDEFFNGYNIKLKSFTEFNGAFKDADELHGTAETNAVGKKGKENSGKYFTIRQSVKSMKHEKFLKLLEKNEDVPERSFIMTDDRSATFSPVVMALLMKVYGDNLAHDIKDLLLQNNSLENLLENKIFPGAEIKHLIDAAGGVRNFWREIIRLCDENNVPEKERYIINSTVLTISPFADLKSSAEPRLFVTSASVRSKFTHEPFPKLVYLESDHYTLPPGLDQTMGQLLEIGDFKTFYKKTDIGHALRSIAQSFLLKKTVSEEAITESDYKVGVIGDKLEINGFPTSRTNAKTLVVPHKAEDFFAKNDCIVINGQSVTKDNFTEFGHAMFAAFVAKQTDPRDQNKKIIIHDPNPLCQQLIDIYCMNYDYGYIREYPPRMFSITHTDNELEKSTETHFKRYRRVKDVVYDNTQECRKFENGNNCVFIACSASSDTKINNMMAATSAFNLALQGRDITYGSGDRKMMGAILQGYLAAKDYCKKNHIEFKSELYACSTDNLIARETQHKKPPEKLKRDNFTMAGTIHIRKHELTGRANSVLVLPGGAGTVEELFFYAATYKDKDIYLVDPKGLYKELGIDSLIKNVKIFSSVEEALTAQYGINIDQEKQKYLEKHLFKPKTMVEKEDMKARSGVEITTKVA